MITEQHPLADAPVRAVTPIKSILSCHQQTSAHHERSERSCDRTLQFHDTTSILWIESADEMSAEEIEACYFSTRDYLCFRNREKRMSRDFSGWGFMKGSRNTDLLGVETRLQRFHRRQRSKNAVFAVILEQELRQESTCDTVSSIEEDDIILSQVYRQYTRESTRLARERAISNATQVEKLFPSSLRTNGSLMNETISNLGLPWEIPISNRNKIARNRSADTVAYSSCSHPIFPHHYLELSYPEKQLNQSEESQDFRYENQSEIPTRGLHNGSRRQEAPIQQQIIGRKETYDFRRHMLHLEAQDEYQSTSKNSFAGAIAQKWMWSPNYCDLGPPTTPLPRFLSWNVH
uniref:Uncharacterized protein n=1 Tax=Pseudo-nitzschia australis TaxID=44445 RepID=A0A7S4EN25_9STRA|mmetsp:Transcript_18101/g.39454  ORF Transcript_18101/g.39454 Transcript_18101/m.39454 type:complete len:348 (+) Transcript_18101:351-1394(+)|eukprot:CAMPEP_0168195832 /NCGR_PEP_ID=MMETSP0139_2-20121125/20119_1 /TAXON_ID=44445 /ORGANISM="Pseudo-nitzschia australis, Strain 10249 10 AB" /LENGTH=347 /DNA_ID=CAMNT_0008119819 /DNA_START=277 /DNA_END=1320 /DNA_ORIENTATION=-